MQPREAPVGILLRVHFHINVGLLQLSNHRIQVANPIVHHPTLLLGSEIIRIHREGRERGLTRRLLPPVVTVLRGYRVNSKMELIPLRQLRRIMAAEEESTDAQYTLGGQI